MQVERHTLELPTVQSQNVWEESQRVLRRDQIPPEPTLRTLLQIREVSAARVAHVRPRDDPAIEHRGGIRRDRIS